MLYNIKILYLQIYLLLDIFLYFDVISLSECVNYLEFVLNSDIPYLKHMNWCFYIDF